MTINFRNLLRTVEITVTSAVAAFLASVSTTSGSSFDLKHIETAGVAAAIALAYRLSGVVSVALQEPATVAAVPAVAPAVAVEAPAAVSVPAVPSAAPTGNVGVRPPAPIVVRP